MKRFKINIIVKKKEMHREKVMLGEKASVPRRAPVSMLAAAKLSGYLLSLLLAPELFFAGGQSLSQGQILLLLRAAQ